jgi:hypothetical protein
MRKCQGFIVAGADDVSSTRTGNKKIKNTWQRLYKRKKQLLPINHLLF